MVKKQTQKGPQVRPLGDRVLITEDKEESGRKTASGIYIPETVKENGGAKQGIVVAVGEGRITEDGTKIPLTVKKGDRVLFSWGDGVKVDGVEYQIVSESGILGIIE
ncbi:MAG: co-chaperone GroES [Candidatus Paceibacterota bacterium]